MSKNRSMKYQAQGILKEKLRLGENITRSRTEVKGFDYEKNTKVLKPTKDIFLRMLSLTFLLYCVSIYLNRIHFLCNKQYCY